MSVITNQLDLLSDVLEDFCTKYNLECMSADDILYGSSDNELTNYQREWLRNYISIWDTIANLWGLIIMFKSETFGRISNYSQDDINSEVIRRFQDISN